MKFYYLAKVQVNVNGYSVELKKYFLIFHLKTVIEGAVSVQLQMLNAQSRKYFNRAFSISGSAFQDYVFRRQSHVELVQNCSRINGISQMIEYLKATNSGILTNFCVRTRGQPSPVWVPNYESPNAKGAFLSQKIENIYNSNNAPVMDAMFAFASQVYFKFNLNSFHTLYD